MKKITFALMLLMFAIMSNAQNADYKVVFDFTSKDTVNQQTLLREMSLIKQYNPDAKLEAVIYGQGLSLVTNGVSNRAEEVARLSSQKDVSFKVCAMSMKRQNINESQLLSGVGIVPDGIYEIISKQRDGWGYIKIAH
ncbi:MAG TPA: DsrE family protein [Hanamia sp.]|nr:DsrE family protein [Hanamia sp.]